MSMFGKADSAVRAPDDKVKSIIASETFFQGTIRTNGSLIVDGKVEGNIYDSNHVVIGDQGQIQGDIVSETVIVGGKVIGNIQAAKMVQILTKGQVLGDIRTKSLHIEDGAVFDGTCTMNVEASGQERTHGNGADKNQGGKPRLTTPLVK